METQGSENRLALTIPCTTSSEQRISICSEGICVPFAVLVKNASKSFIGGGTVINELNMAVPRGTIYSLLGSSGSGKSTTLSCILGLTKFSSGQVYLFGKGAGSTGIGIPGRNVGYMPQDYSLYNELSIMETFRYFGVLNGMNGEEIATSIAFYTKLLQLPKNSCWVGKLSGGQRRRLSLAISVQHKPKLLLLDEPTVGIDALLRKSIWKYLWDLTREHLTTVIITTHYIEEARQSDKIGIMKEGKLSAEDSPLSLMEIHGVHSLEAVVLELTRGNYNNIPTSWETSNVNPDVTNLMPSKESKTYLNSHSNTLKRIQALILKNVMVTTRNLAMLIMIVGSPMFASLGLLIGVQDLRSIAFGVVNNELSNKSVACHELKKVWDGTCDMNYFSCKYLSHLSVKTFQLEEFHSIWEAEEAARQGDVFGFLQIPSEFSWYFYERAVSGIRSNPDENHKSTIFVRMDESNAITSRLVKMKLFSAFQEFSRSLAANCNFDPRAGEHPLSYKHPVMGEQVDDFRDFLVPSIAVGVLFIFPIMTTGIRYVGEKRDGMMERSLVAGIQMWEIFLAYSVTEFFVSLLRMAVMYGVAVYVFQVTSVGSLWLQLFLGLFVSYMGVGAGFLFGSFCTEEIHVALLAMAIFLPNMFISGMLWPVEGMPVGLQKIVRALPCTLSCEAMRSITSRGWGFLHPNVWPGFAVSLGYTIFFLLIAIAVGSLKFIK